MGISNEFSIDVLQKFPFLIGNFMEIFCKKFLKIGPQQLFYQRNHVFFIFLIK